MARPVRECKSSKKCLKHFFDTLVFIVSPKKSRVKKGNGRSGAGPMHPDTKTIDFVKNISLKY